MGVDVLCFNEEVLVIKLFFCFFFLFLHWMKMAALHDWHFFSSNSVFQGACVYGNEIFKVLYIEAFVTKDL